MQPNVTQINIGGKIYLQTTGSNLIVLDEKDADDPYIIEKPIFTERKDGEFYSKLPTVSKPDIKFDSENYGVVGLEVKREH